MPSSLIYGENTGVLPFKDFNRFAKWNDIELTMMPNGGHMFPLEQPEKTAALIKTLIKHW